MADSPLRVLCVDDEPGLAALVAAYLERDDGIDCDAVAETDPEAALDRIEREAFDCVVSDYDMPGRTGVELLSAARETEPDLPFLLFSATEPDAVAAETVRAGVSDYVAEHDDTDGYTALLRRVGPAADVALDGVCTVAPDGTFEFVGEEYGRLYGYEPEELVGERWQRLHPDEAVERIRTDAIPAAMEGERWTGRSEGLRADGSTFAASTLVSTASDDRLVVSASPFEAVDGGTAASD